MNRRKLPGVASATKRLADGTLRRYYYAWRADPTGAARQARFRERRRELTVTAEQATVTPNERNGLTMITTVEMCALAGRLTSDDVTDIELQLAGGLILMLVQRLPADASLDVTMLSAISGKEPRTAERTAAAGARPRARR